MKTKEQLVRQIIDEINDDLASGEISPETDYELFNDIEDIVNQVCAFEKAFHLTVEVYKEVLNEFN